MSGVTRRHEGGIVCSARPGSGPVGDEWARTLSRNAIDHYEATDLHGEGDRVHF